ncbi:MAG: hypothetical protein GY797_40295 [Deltaproteobacteria bacterium]|nr:hypothetical protein [Deltaproteobacteria bacterium]MCP4978153.1 hypothetical protein [Maribacter sp.]
MKESPFGFQYSWQDIQPVRALFVTVLVAQAIGAGICLWISPLPSWFDNLWMGGALGTFPGYLAGLPIQMRIRPGRIEETEPLWTESPEVQKHGLKVLFFDRESIVKLKAA